MNKVQADLDYLMRGLFTYFYPNTQAGRTAWFELDRDTATGKVPTAHLVSTLAQLKVAGYTVNKL